MKTVLIAGASGLIGEAAAAVFANSREYKVVTVSRRKPEGVPADRFRHLSVDLTDRSACAALAPDLTGVTHVVYAALSEKPGLYAGWLDAGQMQLNLSMMANLMDPLLAASPGLRHVSLLQGTKAYGPHVGHHVPLPAREDAPRDAHENFYWLHEDYVRDAARTHGFGWTVFRPQVVMGAAWGVAMNPMLPLAAYAAIRREEGKPFSFPGGALQLMELADSRLIAQAFAWAAEAPEASNQIFNLTNGDIFAWREGWPSLAAGFGIEVGPDEALRIGAYVLERAEIWDRIVAREGLRPLPLAAFLGESHHYIDILLQPGEAMRRPVLLSTIKVRQAGFAPCYESLGTFGHWIATMRQRRLIPAGV